MKHTGTGKPAELALGESLKTLRLTRDLSRMQLGRRVNATDRQIMRYEAGSFIPLPMLEKLAEALDAPLPKKTIRRISALREKEKSSGFEREELIDMYRTLFTPDDDA